MTQRLETVIRGQGCGTVWNFIHQNGSFNVEFRCDAENHFVCSEFPAHSHWSIENETLLIDFGQYGEFVMNLESTSGNLVGNKKGSKGNWRKCELIRSLTETEAAVLPDDGHHHGHNHCQKQSGCCDHK